MTHDWSTRFEQARARQQKRHAQYREKELTRIGDTPFELRLPDDVFARVGGTATREQAEWTCETCGESPACREYANGFVPGKCACQLAQLQREREERERLEQWKAQQQRLRAMSATCYNWLGEAWSSFGMECKTFENFEDELQSDGFTAAVEFAWRKQGNMVLWSDTSWGTGKTHLAAAIANYLLAAGVSCRFTTAQNLFDAFGARMESDRGYSDLLAEAGKTPLLVIDDLDKVHLTKSGYKQSIFFEVLNQRDLRHLPTVITTNARVVMTSDDVQGLSEYIGHAAASRLCDQENGGLSIVEMNGEDYRRRAR